MIHWKDTLSLHSCVGLLGVSITLLAYALLQAEKIKAETALYCLLNVLGSTLILYSLFFDWNLSAFIMEGLWLILSVYGFWRLSRRRRRSSR